MAHRFTFSLQSMTIRRTGSRALNLPLLWTARDLPSPTGIRLLYHVRGFTLGQFSFPLEFLHCYGPATTQEDNLLSDIGYAIKNRPFHPCKWIFYFPSE